MKDKGDGFAWKHSAKPSPFSHCPVTRSVNYTPGNGHVLWQGQTNRPRKMDTKSGCRWRVKNQTPSSGHSWYGRQVSAKPRTLDTHLQRRISVKPLAVDISVSVRFWYNSAQPVGTERKNTMARKDLNTEELAELRKHTGTVLCVEGLWHVVFGFPIALGQVAVV